MTRSATTYAKRVLREVGAWTRDHLWQADGLLAVVLFAFSTQQVPSGSAVTQVTAIVVSALLAATVVPRRRYPVAAFAAAAVIVAAQITLGLAPNSQEPVPALQPNATDVAILVLLYTLAAYRPRSISLAGLAICLVGSAVAIASWSPAHGVHADDALFGAAGLGGAALTAWVLGDSVAYRYRRAYYASLEERAARLEAERDAQARIAAAAERARELQETRARAVDESAARLRRIERDLHDGAQVRLAYFCAAELLANVAKHSGASRVTVGVREQGSGLLMSVIDDGDGGARLVPGGGLAGLLERVQTVDGRLDVDSPVGGPTVVTVELPRHA
jgi:signal transduction histidine kinase